MKAKLITKVCAKCVRDWPDTAEFFTVSGGKLLSECRHCKQARDRDRRASNKRRLGWLDPVRGLGAPVEGTTAPPPNKRAGRPYTFCVLSDVHVPEHDVPTWEAVKEWIRDNQPDEIILNGDFLELSSCSQHGGSPDITSLNSDLEAGKSAIEELIGAAPAALITYQEGNHETRQERFILAKAPSLHASLTIRDGLDLDQMGVKWVGEQEQPISRGTIDLLHGHQVSAGKNSSLPKHHAAKLVDLYGKPGRTVVMGHSHRIGVFVKAGHGGNQTGVGLPCMRTMDPKWLHGHMAGWDHGFGIGYVVEGQESQFNVVKVSKGKFIWNGKQYGA